MSDQKYKDVIITYERLYTLPKRFENHRLSVSLTVPEVDNDQLEAAVDQLIKRIQVKTDELHKTIVEKEQQLLRNAGYIE